MNLKQAKELVRGRLSDKRYEHTLNVRKMAVKLAKRYGVDEDKAALAALLHDLGQGDQQGRDARHHAGPPGTGRGRGRAPHPGVARHLRRHPGPHRVGRGG
ncbi:MAG: HD domain-containing protein [Faecalibacterium sp.]